MGDRGTTRPSAARWRRAGGGEALGGREIRRPVADRPRLHRPLRGRAPGAHRRPVQAHRPHRWRARAHHGVGGGLRRLAGEAGLGRCGRGDDPRAHRPLDRPAGEVDPALSALLALEAFERDPGSLDAVAAAGRRGQRRRVPVCRTSSSPRPDPRPRRGVRARRPDPRHRRQRRHRRHLGRRHRPAPHHPRSATPTGSGPSPTPPTAGPSPPPATTPPPSSGTPPPASRSPRSPATPTGSRASPTPPTASTLATASDDTTAIIWDAATGHPLTTPHRPHRLGQGHRLRPRRPDPRHRQRRHHRHHLGHRHRPTRSHPHRPHRLGQRRSPTPPTARPSPPPATTPPPSSGTPPPANPCTPSPATPTGSGPSPTPPTASTLATASDDTTAIIWDTTTGQPLSHPHRPHRLGQRPSPTPPTASTLATASDDTTAMIWDAATGQAAHPPRRSRPASARPSPSRATARRVAIAADTCRPSTTSPQEAPGRELDIGRRQSPTSRSRPADESLVSGDDHGRRPAVARRHGHRVTRRCSTATPRSRPWPPARDGRLVAAATPRPRRTSRSSTSTTMTPAGRSSAIDADVVDLAFEPDGEVLAVAQADGTVSSAGTRSTGARSATSGSRTTHRSRSLATGGSAESWRVAAAYDDGPMVVWSIVADEVRPSAGRARRPTTTPVDLRFNAERAEVGRR